MLVLLCIVVEFFGGWLEILEGLEVLDILEKLEVLEALWFSPETDASAVLPPEKVIAEADA